jgi:hypothetical protein
MTNLHGASMKGIELAGASLRLPILWRTRFEPKTIEGAYFMGTEWDSKYFVVYASGGEQPGWNLWTKENYIALKAAIERNVPAGPRIEASRVILGLYGQDTQRAGAAGRDAALERIDVVDPRKPFMFEAEMSKWKKRIEANTVRLDVKPDRRSERKILKHYMSLDAEHKKALAAELKALVCSGDANAVYILLGRAETDLHKKTSSSESDTGVLQRIEETGTQSPALVDAILNPDCPVSSKLSEDDKARLRTIRTKKEAEEKTARKK